MPKFPDFEGLAMFAKVAEERSYAGAARSMDVSVATVSRAVSRLEDRLGGRLFNRSSRRLALTDFGREFADRAARIYADAQDIECIALETARRPRGVVRLAVPMSFGTRWVAPILPDFFRQYYTSIKHRGDAKDRRSQLVPGGGANRASLDDKGLPAGARPSEKCL
jgi:DNA-binding transcriptional LysR family regulator